MGLCASSVGCVTIALVIRPLAPQDAEPTRLIYNDAVLNSRATLDLEPRTPTQQDRWVQDHMGIYSAIVAEHDGQVIGFASLSPYRTRPGYSSSVEDSIYVAHGLRGSGVGRQLLGELLRSGSSLGFHACFARVNAESTASLGLHFAHNFRMVGIEKEVGRKFSRWIDVALLERML